MRSGPEGLGGVAPAWRRLLALGLATRLAILTALLAIALVLAGSQIALTWSQRVHFEEDRRESMSIATTLADYLVSVAPTGNVDSLTRGFESWAKSDISGADASIYVLAGARLAPIRWADSAAEPPPGRATEAALVQRATQARLQASPEAAWHVDVPLGTARPYGVLSVTIPTQRLADLRGERRRMYILAVASALLVGLGVAGLTARWVGRPLNELGEAMARAHGGPGPAPEASEIGPHEFRALARRYNELLRALADRERESTARAALLDLEARARDYDRLAVTAETTAELAHEIGTPLSTIRGHVQLLRDDLAKAGEIASVDRINSLLAQLDRVTAIVQTGLERGALPAPAVTRADLSNIAIRLVRFLEPTLQAAGVRAEVRPDGAALGRSAALARCDPALVEQIILNLLKNAIEALPPGGHIRVTTGANGPTAHVVVADDGPGLSPEARAYLFNPFATTKGPSGTGLGLVISRRLARALGGELAYVPTDRGTEWRLTLPADAGAGGTGEW